MVLILLCKTGNSRIMHCIYTVAKLHLHPYSRIAGLCIASILSYLGKLGYDISCLSLGSLCCLVVYRENKTRRTNYFAPEQLSSLNKAHAYNEVANKGIIGLVNRDGRKWRAIIPKIYI